MAVKIRLARFGKKHAPFYRLIAIDSRRKRDGQYLDIIGTYDVLKSSVVQFYPERYDRWISQGAIPTISVQKIYKLYKKSGAPAAASTNQNSN